MLHKRNSKKSLQRLEKFGVLNICMEGKVSINSRCWKRKHGTFLSWREFYRHMACILGVYYMEALICKVLSPFTTICGVMYGSVSFYECF